MPGYKKYGKKKKFYKRKRQHWYDTKYSIKEVAQTALSTANYVRSLINVEKKFCDNTQTSQIIGKALTVYPLNNISEGSDYNQRTGISVKGVSSYLRYSCRLDPAATLNQIRVIMFEDKENQGTTPGGNDLLENGAFYLSPINHVNGQRWNILYDKMVTLDVNGRAVVDLKSYKTLNTHYKWSSTTGTSTYNSSIYLGFISDNNTNSPIVDFYHRLRFVDN